jgi:hypothetical protein
VVERDISLPKPFLDVSFVGVIRWKSLASEMFFQFAKHVKDCSYDIFVRLKVMKNSAILHVLHFLVAINTNFMQISIVWQVKICHLSIITVQRYGFHSPNNVHYVNLNRIECVYHRALT